MLSLRHNPHAAPSRWQYRFSRFLLSRLYWVLTRFVAPIALILFVVFQLWTSQGMRQMVADTKASIFQKIAYLPFFVVDDVVISNATALREEEIMSFIDIQAPKSILEFDRDEMRKNLSQMDAVGSSEIRYNYTGTMEIILEPRIPAMIYYDGALFETIDESGHRVEGLADRSGREELFVISGEGAKDSAGEAMRIVKMLNPLADRVRGLVRVGGRRWDVVLTNGAILMLPAESPMSALQLILKQHRTNEVLNREIQSYDMRIPARPILRVSPVFAAEIETTIADQS